MIARPRNTSGTSCRNENVEDSPTATGVEKLVDPIVGAIVEDVAMPPPLLLLVLLAFIVEPFVSRIP